jgi:hypothetical protein
MIKERLNFIGLLKYIEVIKGNRPFIHSNAINAGRFEGLT